MRVDKILSKGNNFQTDRESRVTPHMPPRVIVQFPSQSILRTHIRKPINSDIRLTSQLLRSLDLHKLQKWTVQKCTLQRSE